MWTEIYCGLAFIAACSTMSSPWQWAFLQWKETGVVLKLGKSWTVHHLYLSVRLTSVLFYCLIAEASDKLKAGPYLQVMPAFSCLTCLTYLCIGSRASWGCVGGKACFQAFCAALENAEAQCLVLMLWCHLTVRGDLQLGRAKDML